DLARRGERAALRRRRQGHEPRDFAAAEAGRSAIPERARAPERRALERGERHLLLGAEAAQRLDGERRDVCLEVHVDGHVRERAHDLLQRGHAPFANFAPAAVGDAPGDPEDRAPSGSCEVTRTPSAVACKSVSSASAPSSSARWKAGMVFSGSSRDAPRWAYTRTPALGMSGILRHFRLPGCRTSVPRTMKMTISATLVA